MKCSASESFCTERKGCPGRLVLWLVCRRAYSSLRGFPAELFSSRSLAELTTCAAKGPLHQASAQAGNSGVSPRNRACARPSGCCRWAGGLHLVLSSSLLLAAPEMKHVLLWVFSQLKSGSQTCGVFRGATSDRNHGNTCMYPPPALCMRDPAQLLFFPASVPSVLCNTLMKQSICCRQSLLWQLSSRFTFWFNRKLQRMAFKMLWRNFPFLSPKQDKKCNFIHHVLSSKHHFLLKDWANII